MFIFGNINQNSIVYLTFNLNEHIVILNGPKIVELVICLFTCLLTDRIEPISLRMIFNFAKNTNFTSIHLYEIINLIFIFGKID